MDIGQSNSCCEYDELSRRQFLGAASGAAVLAAGMPAWLPQVVLAQDHCSLRDVLVSVYLRGGCDGMTMCVPHGEDPYYQARPLLNIPRPDSRDPNRAIDLDGFFGFPQSMKALLVAFDSGRLAIIHAAGLRNSTRSHFDAQRFMEVGDATDKNLFTGWLGRHLATSTPMRKKSILRAVGISHGLQVTLAGGPKALPVPDLADFGLTGNPDSEARRRVLLADMYGQVRNPLKAAGRNTQATIDLLASIDFKNYKPSGGAVYPESPFGYALKSTAALIKAEVGVEAIAIDRHGWDHHNNQGPIEGLMATMMEDFSATVAAFHADMFFDMDNVTMVIMSEFGRRLAENGSNGTDHGYGNVMFVMGGFIDGGRVVTDWPGLAPEKLFQGIDLDATIDYRDVLSEIVSTRLYNHQNLDRIFPNYTPKFPGITLACARIVPAK